MTLLELEEVSAGYGVAPNTLDGISLDVEAGRIYAVIGPNGAGKSTMLKVIAGLLPPRAGRVLWGGRGGATALNGLRPDQILAKGLCFVPQDRCLFPDMTVRENLRMGGYLERNHRVVERRVRRVFEVFPQLGERSGQRAGTLSGGQQQMAALGRALMVEPELLMVDEPSLGLAPQVTEQIFAQIRAFTALGTAVVMVEQNARRALECSDWAYVLDLGRKRFEGPADGMLSDPRIHELYLGKRPGSTDRSGDRGDGAP